MKNLPMKPIIPDRALETAELYLNELLEILDLAGDIRETEVLASMEDEQPPNLLEELAAEQIRLRSQILEIVLTVATSVASDQSPASIRSYVHGQLDELHLDMMMNTQDKDQDTPSA